MRWDEMSWNEMRYLFEIDAIEKYVYIICNTRLSLAEINVERRPCEPLLWIYSHNKNGAKFKKLNRT